MVPVLLVIFNRPELISKQIEILKKANVKKIYISSDGPRNSISGECKIVASLRQKVIDLIDWDCKVFTLFNKENLGCKYAVNNAIKWFFSIEDKGIVLEDDIIPSLNFFNFCNDCLSFFEDKKEIFSITGRNELSEWGESDIFFTNRFNCWGWASWADRIFDVDVEYGYERNNDYSQLYNKRPWEERCYVDSVLGLLQTDQVNSWAYSYDLFCKSKNYIHVYPRKNMISNIGFSHSGTHSSSWLEDNVFFHESFLPSVDRQINVIDDIAFSKKKLRSEYRNVFYLFVFKYIRYLKSLRIIRKKIMRLL